MPVRKVLVAALALSLIIVCLTVTNAAITFNRYTSSQYGFEIDYPSTWEVNSSLSKTAIAFVSPFESKRDKFREVVYITIEKEPVDQVTLEAYSPMVWGNMKSNLKSARLRSANHSTLSGQAAHDLSVTFRQSGQSMQVLLRHTIINKQVYTVTFLCQKKEFKSMYPTVLAMMNSFKLK